MKNILILLSFFVIFGLWFPVPAVAQETNVGVYVHWYGMGREKENLEEKGRNMSIAVWSAMPEDSKRDDFQLFAGLRWAKPSWWMEASAGFQVVHNPVGDFERDLSEVVPLTSFHFGLRAEQWNARAQVQWIGIGADPVHERYYALVELNREIAKRLSVGLESENRFPRVGSSDVSVGPQLTTYLGPWDFVVAYQFSSESDQIRVRTTLNW